MTMVYTQHKFKDSDIPIDDFRAMPIIAKYFIDKNLEDIVVVSPDHGGATRARV